MPAERLTAALADRYRIERELGAGGMANVFLAHDLRHGRKVALKVLKPELAAVIGGSRFLAEIRTTANLQHPHILPLHDSGEVREEPNERGEGGSRIFYVMPYVDGESLRDRLTREKQLPVETAVRIASEVADALQYAHRHGVVHRDIKPENILLHGGHALVADFGISLAAANTASSRMTETGMSLGTPAYMSPEQATGDRAVDGRADVYSLGAVTYEMLVGDPPHVASTAQAIMAKVLTEKPPSVRKSRPNVPGHVDAAVARALEKLAADRFETAHEFADALAGKGATAAAPVTDTLHAGRRVGLRIWQAAAAALALAAAGSTWIAFRATAAARTAADAAPVIRSTFDLPAVLRVNDALAGTPVAVSPRGDMVAYTSVGVQGLRTFIRHLKELTAREVLDANNLGLAGRNLTFSPDGRWLAFTEGNVLRKVSVDGGQTTNIVPALISAVPYGLSWSDNDTIFVGSFTGLEAVPASGGTPVKIGLKDSSSVRIGQRWPLALPGGRAVIYATGNSASEIPRLAVLDVRTREVTVHDLQVSVPLGLLAGHLVFVAPVGTVMAVPFDLASRRPTGPPVPLDEGIVVDPTGGAKASLSASGTLVYLRGRAEFQPVMVSPGLSQPVPLIRELNIYSTPRFSPEGNRVAVTVVTSRSSDIWIYDIARNTLTRLTSEGTNVRPEWTPDGTRVLFRSERGGKPGIWWQPADGSGPAELLYEPPMEPFEAIVSPDAKWLVIRTAPGATHSRDILAVPMQGERTITPLVTGPSTESLPRISPDGKWLVYQSNESGPFQIYVRPFPGSGARVQVSTSGGTEPIWSRSGRALYYRDELGQITEVAVTTGAAFSIGERRIVATGDYLTDASHANWDVAPDGRFLFLKRAGAESQTIVVHNWIRELREKTAARR